MTQMKYYVDETGAYLGGWDANPPAGALEVPVAPDDVRQVWSGSEWQPAVIAPPPLALTDECSALLTVTDGEVSNVTRTKEIGGAFSFGGTAYVYFMVPFPDTSYIAICNAAVVKFPDRVEVPLAGLDTVKLIIQQVG